MRSIKIRYIKGKNGPISARTVTPPSLTVRCSVGCAERL